MKTTLLSLLAAATLAVTAFAQTPTQPAASKSVSAFEPVATLPVTGTMQIAYRTRSGDASKPGVTDVYTISVNVANSAVFHGTIENLPYIANTITSDQVGRVTYDVDLDVVNPKNVTQTRNVGKVTGYSPIDKQNVYHYESGGGIKVIVFPIGAAKGFESRFNGLALGKPPAVSGFKKLSQDAVKLVSSKGGSIILTKYDKMTFQNHLLPMGPVQIYPETTVNGTLFYDYDRTAWHFNQVHFVYNAEGRRADDILTGSIRWIEAKNRKQTGEGHYEFDIRVNEPPPTESAIFAATADESSFFDTPTDIPSLTGTMSYKDSFSGDTVVGSMVTIELKATRLSKAQAMYLVKCILLSCLVPFNAE